MTNFNDFDEKQKALFQHLSGDYENDSDGLEEFETDWEPTRYDDCIFENGNTQYMVLDDQEADQRWEEYLDNYIDECILPDLPKSAKYYFDSEKWKNDARHDGRGHCLSGYDGCEHEYKIDNEWYYVYRVN